MPPADSPGLYAVHVRVVLLHRTLSRQARGGLDTGSGGPTLAGGRWGRITFPPRNIAVPSAPAG